MRGKHWDAEYRGFTLGSSFKIIFIYNDRTACFDMPPHGRGAGSWFQFFGVLRLVDVADDLSQQVARFGQEGSRGIRLDIRPSLPQRRVRSTRLTASLRSRSYGTHHQWRIINRHKVVRREQVARPRRDHGRAVDEVQPAKATNHCAANNVLH